MNFEYLKSFYSTVIHNSISKAAADLHLTQPGLSMQIKHLEGEIGAKLLIRSNKGVELTEEGKVVYNYASTILSIKGNIERDLKNLQENNPKLIIGSCKSVGEYALPCSIYIFKKLHNEVDISIELMNSTEVIEKLLNHTINIGIIQGNPQKGNIVTKYLASDELVLVGSASNTNRVITIEELKEMPLILREKNSSTRYLAEKALQEEGVNTEQLNVIYDLNSPEAIKSSISAGKGFSFLPKLIIKKEQKEGSLGQIQVNDLKITFDYYIAFRKDYVFTQYEQLFVDFIVSNKRGFC
ncbi:HTH-type transcriptional regulator YofA [Pelotomaculum schinkii]|uniref:HTH-type transcriptional regulator YofA n=1 Tax=Pelotomaculum schinkii TaxID=78350 RepID=A0A4Y7R6J0_9FIRM|nr:LysR family transcriptional regulator [Pelotomaculum schinkii]TEB04376.1 HTH-type transcriptional regulator YofA [Pelotomaculum schinkii]